MDIVKTARYEIPVLYLDNHLLVVEKPANMVCQADRTGDDDLLSVLKKYIGEKFQKPGSVYLGLVHRLDRPVGGVMVFARTSKAAARLSQAFSAHTVRKEYLAVTQTPVPEEARYVDFLKKNEKTGMVQVVSATVPGAKEARLTTCPVATRNDMTLTRVQLETGRAHQIRVQHMRAGHPLWGDARYGGGKPGQQIALWAYHLVIEHPTQKTPLSFISAPPVSGIWRVFEPEIVNISQQPCDNMTE